MRLEETVRDLGAQFGIAPEDLKLDLGPGRKADVRRARVILNPSSGRERGPEYVDLLNTTLKRHFEDVEDRGDGRGRRRRARRDGGGGRMRVMFVAGGDGTLNEVMNGLATAGALGRVVIGIVPLGPATTSPPASTFRSIPMRRSTCSRGP